jgi:DNA-binding MarR family transcriptional regulator
MSSQPIQPVSFGHSVALAQQALTGALTAVVVAEGSSAEEWFALNTIAMRGPQTPGETIRHELRVAPRATAAGVDATLAELAAAGLVAVDGEGSGEVLALTSEGTAHHARLATAVRGLTAAMIEGLDPEALAVTSALLATVTERAHVAAAAAVAA